MPTFPPAQLATVTAGHWTALPSTEIRGFTQDTRLLAPGQMFVALRTEKRDGHDFLAEAAARGASAALVSRALPGSPLPQLIVADPLTAFQAIASTHRAAFTGPVIGISGSAGKTSTKDLLTLLLGGSPAVHATQGNLNNHLGVPLTLTQLDSATHRAAVIEAGINAPGDMAPLANMIQPDHAIITFVGPAHLEKLGSLDGVAAEKVLLPAAVRLGGLSVFPVSCWAFAPFRELANPLVLAPANESMVPVSGRRLLFTVLHRPDRTEVSLGGDRPFLLRRVSTGMAQNAALALALARELGVLETDLHTRLAGWQPSHWRGELRRVGDADIYCDFYNANPASMQDALTAFDSLADPTRPRLYVLGGMEELGDQAPALHRALGRTILLRPRDHACLIGDHAAALREGLLENGADPAQIEILTDLAPARERLSHFNGAAFLKASRRYRLETLLDPAASAHA